MKVVSNDYKTAIKQMGREIDAKIIYVANSDTIELGAEQLNSVTPHYEGNILKSVMKQLDIDSNVNIPIGTILEAKFGVFTGLAYEYISFGNFIVYSSEKQEDLNSYKIVCYDKLLWSMKDYETPEVSGTPITYPITLRNYLSAICTHLGITFGSISDNFANYNRQIPSELFLDADGKSLNYTFRDVLDQIAQATASTICINANDELEVRYLTNSGETIDEEYLKDINVNFGEKFGAINTIVLSRSAEADNIYYPDPLPANPVELKIKDNQLMNDDNRADYLPDIYNKLNGLEFYTNDFVSTGITYLDLCDKYNVSIDGTTYNCVMLNDEIQITQGLVENIHTKMPDETQTDYNTSSKDDRTQNRTTLIVDKVNNQITALTTKTNQLEESIEVLRADLDTNIVIVSTTDTGLPFDNKTYEIDYSVKYLGEPLLTGYSVSTSDTHTGITTDFSVLGKLKFSVSTGTAITSEDNKYTITFSYTNSGITYTSTRAIMISTLVSETEQNVIISALEPADTSVLWYDTTDNVLKSYDDGDWVEVNSADNDIQNLTDMITGENGLQNKYDDLSNRISSAESDLNNKVDNATYNSFVSQVESTQGNYYTKTEISQIVSGESVDGVVVTAVKSTSATFDINGMHYQKSTSDTISTIDEQGLSVDDSNNNELFFAGVRSGSSTSIVQTANLNSNEFIIFGNNKGRLQKFTDPDANIDGIGLFLL